MSEDESEGAPITAQGTPITAQDDEPVSPGKLQSARNTLAATAPENTATQKIPIEYLKKMVTALVVTFTAYNMTQKRESKPC